jgi:hypothetical protein
MSITISQNLPVPPGLADGQVADATQILPLYASLNAFVIPGTIGVFQQSFVDDVQYTVATGSAKNWSFSPTQKQNKSGFYFIPFSWSGGPGPAFTYNVNGSAVTAAAATTSAATGNGIVIVFMGAGHDAIVPQSMFALQVDTGGTSKFVVPNTNLPAADITSFGIAVTGTGTVNFMHVRFWSEG